MRATIVTVAAALVVAAGTVTAGITGVPTTSGQPLPAYATCQEEDGSTPGQAFPCYWDAATQGNGQGESYLLAEPMTCDYAQSFGPTQGCPQR